MLAAKTSLANNHFYHIYTKSIAEFTIFRDVKDYERMLEIMTFYSNAAPPCKYSTFKELKNNATHLPPTTTDEIRVLIEIIAYCIMPTHIHFILRQAEENGISKYMNTLLIGYSRYFNLKYKRKGPLWEGRFKRIHIDNDDYLLHLTRYIHLNPATACLVKKPEEWYFSSYKEYLDINSAAKNCCKYAPYLEISPDKYRRFVEDRTEYQRELALIKHLTME